MDPARSNPQPRIAAKDAKRHGKSAKNNIFPGRRKSEIPGNTGGPEDI
jgi:hypothetical protein